jgi:hypothetical protein
MRQHARTHHPRKPCACIFDPCTCLQGASQVNVCLALAVLLQSSQRTLVCHHAVVETQPHMVFHSPPLHTIDQCLLRPTSCRGPSVFVFSQLLQCPSLGCLLNLVLTDIYMPSADRELIACCPACISCLFKSLLPVRASICRTPCNRAYLCVLCACCRWRAFEAVCSLSVGCFGAQGGGFVWGCLGSRAASTGRGGEHGDPPKFAAVQLPW